MAARLGHPENHRALQTLSTPLREQAGILEEVLILREKHRREHRASPISWTRIAGERLAGDSRSSISAGGDLNLEAPEAYFRDLWRSERRNRRRNRRGFSRNLRRGPSPTRPSSGIRLRKARKRFRRKGKAPARRRRRRTTGTKSSIFCLCSSRKASGRPWRKSPNGTLPS
jgi:hypothetical protein